MTKPEDKEYQLTPDGKRLLTELSETLPTCVEHIRKEIRLAYLTGVREGMRHALNQMESMI